MIAINVNNIKKLIIMVILYVLCIVKLSQDIWVNTVFVPNVNKILVKFVQIFMMSVKSVLVGKLIQGNINWKANALKNVPIIITLNYMIISVKSV